MPSSTRPPGRAAQAFCAVEWGVGEVGESIAEVRDELAGRPHNFRAQELRQQPSVSLLHDAAKVGRRAGWESLKQTVERQWR